MSRLSDRIKKTVEDEFGDVEVFDVIFVVASETPDGNVKMTSGSTHESSVEARRIMINHALERIG